MTFGGIFLSACGMVALAGGAYCTLEGCREIGVLLDNRKLSAGKLIGEALVWLAFTAVGFCALVSALHSLAVVWRP